MVSLLAQEIEEEALSENRSTFWVRIHCLWGNLLHLFADQDSRNPSLKKKIISNVLFRTPSGGFSSSKEKFRETI